MSKRLLRNAVRCRRCDDIIESTNTHDLQRCTCGSVSVDGGLDYAKRTWIGESPEEVYEELSEYDDA